MKKLTGPAILAAVLLTHIGFLVATEESYTFRQDELPFIQEEKHQPTVTTVSFTHQAPNTTALNTNTLQRAGF